MVCGNYEHGIVPHGVFIHSIEKLPQIMIAHRKKRGVLIADMVGRIPAIVVPAIVRPVKVLPFIAIIIELLPSLLREERLMWIECLDLQEPVIGRVAALNEIQAILKCPVLRHILLTPDEAAVDPVMAPVLSDRTS